MILDDRPVIDQFSDEYRYGESPADSLYMLEGRVQELTGGTTDLFTGVAEELRELTTTRDYSARGYSRIPLRWEHLSDDEQERVFTEVIDGVQRQIKLLKEYAETSEVSEDVENAFSETGERMERWQESRR